MPDAVEIVFECPPMPIYPDGDGWRITANEPMTAHILTVPDNKLILTIPDIVIPPTRVKQLTTRHLFVRDWLVNRCVGSGKDDAGNSVVSELPEEPTWFQRWGWYFTMVAQEIKAPTRLSLADGSVYEGPVVFPRCPISILSSPMQAAAVVAGGLLTRVS